MTGTDKSQEDIKITFAHMKRYLNDSSQRKPNKVTQKYYFSPIRLAKNIKP